MPMETEKLIVALTENSMPVRRLGHPARRTAVWFAISVCYGILVAAAMGLRPDLSDRLWEWRFVIELVASLLTSMMAAGAAFCAGCPGRPLWERFAPLPFLGLWLATLGQGCWQDWVQFGPAGLRIQPDLICLPIIAAITILPGALILFMIRQGAPIAPVTTTALAALAAAALAATVLRLTHLSDASIMVLVWQLGSVAILSAGAGLFGRKLLHWPARGHLIASHN